MGNKTHGNFVEFNPVNVYRVIITYKHNKGRAEGIEERRWCASQGIRLIRSFVNGSTRTDWFRLRSHRHHTMLWILVPTTCSRFSIGGTTRKSRGSDDGTFLLPTLRLGGQNSGGGIISSQSHY